MCTVYMPTHDWLTCLGPRSSLSAVPQNTAGIVGLVGCLLSTGLWACGR